MEATDHSTLYSSALRDHNGCGNGYYVETNSIHTQIGVIHDL